MRISTFHRILLIALCLTPVLGICESGVTASQAAAQNYSAVRSHRPLIQASMLEDRRASPEDSPACAAEQTDFEAGVLAMAAVCGIPEPVEPIACGVAILAVAVLQEKLDDCKARAARCADPCASTSSFCGMDPLGCGVWCGWCNEAGGFTCQNGGCIKVDTCIDPNPPCFGITCGYDTDICGNTRYCGDNCGGGGGGDDCELWDECDDYDF